MRLNLFMAVLVGVPILFQYRLWFESGGIRDMLQLKRQIAKQQIENDKLKKGNEELLFQVKRLQHGEDATESRARNELGMIKKEEKFYQIVKSEKDAG